MHLDGTVNCWNRAPGLVLARPGVKYASSGMRQFAVATVALIRMRARLSSLASVYPVRGDAGLMLPLDEKKAGKPPMPTEPTVPAVDIEEDLAIAEDDMSMSVSMLF